MKKEEKKGYYYSPVRGELYCITYFEYPCGMIEETSRRLIAEFISGTKARETAKTLQEKKSVK